MNKIEAKVIKIKKEKNAALIKLKYKENIFSAFILNFDDKISIGMKCNILFKENEVMICDKEYKKISARNLFNAKIKNIEEDNIFARILFDFNDITISSLITREAKEALNLEIGAIFGFFIKSNELTLEYLD